MSILKNIFIVTAAIVALPPVIFGIYNTYFFGLIYPNTYIAGVDVSSLSPETASEKLSKKIGLPEKILLAGDGQVFEIDTFEIGLKYDFAASARAAYERTRTGNILYDFGERLIAPFIKKDMGLRLFLDEEKLSNNLSVVVGQVATEPIYPSLKLVKEDIVVDKGRAGVGLDLKILRAQVGKNLAFASKEPIVIPLKEIDPSLTETEAQSFKERAENLKGKGLILKFEFQTFSYKGGDTLNLLDPKKEYSQDSIENIVTDVAGAVNREPQDSVFVFEGGRVNEFAPAKDGITVSSDALAETIKENLRTLEADGNTFATIDIPVERKAPKIQTEDVNNLGIKELIGRGSSRFAGSIPNRIHNISLASSRFKGVLIAPGETFSFNKTLGDVSLFTGYKQAYIIKDGKTILGDGGGVCQVSTTLFRAILNAGLPTIERRAHSYRVAYYEQDSPPGLDATVYDPTADLKFKNDTPAHILIQPIVDTKKATLVFEIYGTSDGRTSTITKPLVANVVPPPEDLYTDDPTLTAGKIKQIDYKAWGAKVTFNYKVERGGENIYQKTFVSNYRPWQAVYLRGTGPSE